MSGYKWSPSCFSYCDLLFLLFSLSLFPPLLYHVQLPEIGQTPPEEEEEADEEETEELGHVDTYAEYKPSKCMTTLYSCEALCILRVVHAEVKLSL